MIKLHQHSLCLVGLLLFATQVLSLSAKQLNATTSFRHPVPERLLESSYEINCPSSSCYNKESLNETEATYQFTLGPNSQANLEFDYEESKQMVVFFDFDPTQTMNYSVSVWSAFLSLEIPPIQAASLAGPFPITLTPSENNHLVISVQNLNQNTSATMSVKITYFDRVFAQVTPVWVVPIAAIGGMAFVLLMLLPVCWFKCARRNQIQHSQVAVAPGPKPDIDKLFPETNFEDLKSQFPQKTCSICFEDFQESQVCRQFTCQHIFHSKCVNPWLEGQINETNKASCPNCKHQVTSAEPVVQKKENS